MKTVTLIIRRKYQIPGITSNTCFMDTPIVSCCIFYNDIQSKHLFQGDGMHGQTGLRTSAQVSVSGRIGVSAKGLDFGIRFSKKPKTEELFEIRTEESESSNPKVRPNTIRKKNEDPSIPRNRRTKFFLCAFGLDFYTASKLYMCILLKVFENFKLQRGGLPFN